jgi:Tfp pilus assembly protein PilE
MSDLSNHHTVSELTFERRTDGSVRPAREACTLLRLLPRNCRGITIIELITVFLLLGVLSAIATKSMLTQKDRAMAAVVESDLRNLAVAQENHFAMRSNYYGQGGGASFVSSPAFDFNPSPGVSVEIRVEGAGWAARAVHEKLVDSEHACAIYVGLVEPYPPAVREGVVSCRPSLGDQRDENDGRGGNEGGQDGNKGNEKKDKKDKKYKKNNRDKNKGDENRRNRRDGDSIDRGTNRSTGDGADGNDGASGNDGSKEGNGTGMSDRTKQADGDGVKEEDSESGGKRENAGGSENKESFKGNDGTGKGENGDDGTKEDGAGDGTGGDGNTDTSGKKDGKNDGGKGNGKGNGG